MRITFQQRFFFLVCSLLLATGVARSQTEAIGIKFEVDGKPIKEKYKIVLSVSDYEIEPEVIKNGFVLPGYFKDYEKIGVRFICAGYELDFGEIHKTKFGGDWEIGVDNPPFEAENLSPADKGKKVVRVHYLHFQPGDGSLETSLTIKLFK